MLKTLFTARQPKNLDYRTDDFPALLRYVNYLANHKLGYPVSLLTYLGVVDNRILGIKPGTLANVLLNNVGDPFKDSETSLLEVKKHERRIISILEAHFGLAPEESRGYVTTGGTEGNFAALWWSKRYLVNKAIENLVKQDDLTKQCLKEEQELTAALAKIPLNDYPVRAAQLQKLLDIKEVIAKHQAVSQQMLTPTVFYAKGPTHYSVPKISEILRLNTRPVIASTDGSMDINSFKKELLLHLGAHPHSPVIVIVNIGTTITGAIDNAPAIKKILDEAQPKPIYTLHLDGALSGFVLPIIKPYGDIANYFDAIGANTIAVSAHKYPGLSQPCGIILAKRTFFEKAFEKSERNIEYVGNIVDVTITGSRSGLNVLMFFNALRTLGLDQNQERLKRMVKENLETARYLYEQLVKLFGPLNVSYPFHFNITFPRPSQALTKKYQLMLTGEKATICVLTNVTKSLIDQFIYDLQREKEGIMTTVPGKPEFEIRPLTSEFAKETAALFAKTFCERETITKHLGITVKEYEPFAKEVVDKAIKEGLGVVALDKHKHVIACAMGEDIANPFKPNLSLYPKLKPIMGLMDKLCNPFLQGKQFKKGKIAHIWITAVDEQYLNKGVSTAINSACTNHAAAKGFEFCYAVFTSPINENIVHHYQAIELINNVKYDDYIVDGQVPFRGIKGAATSYILGITPNTTIDSLPKCYTMDAKAFVR